MKKILVFLLAAFMLPCAARADSYRTLTLDMKGDDVLAMKQRLYELGYFTTASLTDTMTENTLKVIRAFQESNGLETTGTADSRTRGP